MHKHGLHKHHKIPKHMGGSDDPSNIESLTIEEHAERHRILFEMHGCWQDEVAWKALSGQMGNEEAFRLSLKNRKMPKKSEEWKGKMSDRMKGPNNPMFGKPAWNKGISPSPESRIKMREAKLRSGPSKVYQWEITNPDGSKEVITNLTKFCEERGMYQSGMIQVSTGLLKTYKGYRCKKLTNYS